jgi:hypothetical protein
MNERDDTNLSAEESISDEISERVRSVISASDFACSISASSGSRS